MESPKLIPSIAVPEIRVGKTTVTGKGWVAIPFGYTFQEPPSVICIAEGRAGWYKPKEFTPPTVPLPQIDDITAPSVTIPPFILDKLKHDFVTEINKVLPNLQKELSTKFLEDADKVYYEVVRPRLAANPALLVYVAFQDFIHTYLTRALVKGQGALVGWMGDRILSFLISNIDSLIFVPLKGKLNETITNMNTWSKNTAKGTQEAINASLSEITDDVNQLSRDIQQGTQSTVNRLAQQSTDALNKSIDLLWGTLGLEEGTLFSPLSIRNVTASQFEVSALGASSSLDTPSSPTYVASTASSFAGEGDGVTTVHWIAISGVALETPLIELPWIK